MKLNILYPALLLGREWCVHHLPMSSVLHLRVARLRASCTYAGCRVWRGPGRTWSPACDRLHNVVWWKAAAVAWERGQPQGGEGGGATRFVSGSERCLPRSCKLLMHFREEWHRRGALRTSATPAEKQFVQPRRIGTQ